MKNLNMAYTYAAVFLDRYNIRKGRNVYTNYTLVIVTLENYW